MVTIQKVITQHMCMFCVISKAFVVIYEDLEGKRLYIVDDEYLRIFIRSISSLYLCIKNVNQQNLIIKICFFAAVLGLRNDSEAPIVLLSVYISNLGRRGKDAEPA